MLIFNLRRFELKVFKLLVLLFTVLISILIKIICIEVHEWFIFLILRFNISISNVRLEGFNKLSQLLLLKLPLHRLLLRVLLSFFVLLMELLFFPVIVLRLIITPIISRSSLCSPASFFWILESLLLLTFFWMMVWRWWVGEIQKGSTLMRMYLRT